MPPVDTLITLAIAAGILIGGLGLTALALWLDNESLT